MSKTEKVTHLRESAGADDGAARLAVTLTVDELRALIADVVQEHIDDDDGPLLSVDEAAKFLHQSPTYIYRNWKDMGGRKLGKNLRFTKSNLRKWVEEKRGLT
jgi:AraC-like DNA-binding protein